MVLPVLCEVRDVRLVRPGLDTSCTLQITPYHIKLIYAGTEVLLEIALIARAQRETSLPAQAARRPRYLITLFLYTHEYLSLGFADESSLVQTMEVLRAAADIDSVEKMYAFQAPRPSPSAGWSLYNPSVEFKRMGVGSSSKEWRFSSINSDYTLIPTYPALLVEPALTGDSTLVYASKYRSRGRIPTLTYLHWRGHGSITRCSQPLVGLKQNRSIQDEKLVSAIFATGAGEKQGPGVYGATSTNLLVDARPATNAMANIAKGAGTENMEHYRNCKKVYLGVENIHVMRDSLDRAQLVFRADIRPNANLRSLAPIDQMALYRSNWLKHIGDLLDGVVLIVRNIHVHASHVLIHCSDGWDRTAQLTSLAALCLDPYYRTLEGFAVLIEKDWLSFGHRFQERSGLVGLGHDKFDLRAPQNDTGMYSDGGSPEDSVTEFPSTRSFWSFAKHFRSPFQANAAHERSPIFHQFLDCVAQLQAQFPARFEFNGAFLAELLRHVYAGSTGTFLYSSERERRHARSTGLPPVESTPSVWDVLFDDSVRSRWLNPKFDASLDDRSTLSGDMGVLSPRTDSLRFSSDLFQRPYADMNSRLDAQQEGKRRLNDRLTSVSTENVSSDAHEREPDRVDDSLQAAATRMRSLFSDGWGRVQDAMKSAGSDFNFASSDTEQTNGNHWLARTPQPGPIMTSLSQVEKQVEPDPAHSNVSPGFSMRDPWTTTSDTIPRPPEHNAPENKSDSNSTSPPPGTHQDPLGAWQV
ncbi:hypothetical protein MPSI1_001164 [Malassezia psittaci]|uniref:Myotubularin phosphatase domain-containing protein n=1 Tax=Malassezia psittaci TaxID=1821823 RepID=A0AAF0F8W2_9BASI|nr:hypothetical protein MPSI1_001164 [Malassezia psittaci]